MQDSIKQEGALPWLKPVAQAAIYEALVAEAMAEPLRWDRSIVALLRLRGIRTGFHNLQVAAEMRQVDYLHPLREPKFVHSWAAFGGRLGMPGRTAATRVLFEPYLPNEVVRREDKVFFAGARVSGPSRDFIARWQGDGIDTETIDAERLREEWGAPQPHSGSLVLLQAIWLASAS